MKKTLMMSGILAAMIVVPAVSFAEEKVVIKPEVDTWVMQQPDNDSGADVDVTLGATVPEKVKIINVPNDDKYAYVIIKKKRYLVDRDSRKVIKVY